jgi:hypothetical protein
MSGPLGTFPKQNHTMSQSDPIHEQPIEALPPVERLRVPQFDVVHLFAWTALAAILLKYSQAMEVIGTVSSALVDQISDLSQKIAGKYEVMGFWTTKAEQSLSAILTASALVGFAVLVWARLRTEFRRLQPGHWLVLIATIEGTFLLMAWPILEVVAPDGEVGRWSVGYGAVRALTVAVVYTYAASRVGESPRWKIVFVANVLSAWIAFAVVAGIVIFSERPENTPWFAFPIRGGFWYDFGVFILWPLLLFLMVLVAAVVDLVRHTPRDWVHWLGVGIVELGNLPPIATYVYLVFFREWHLYM